MQRNRQSSKVPQRSREVLVGVYRAPPRRVPQPVHQPLLLSLPRQEVCPARPCW